MTKLRILLPFIALVGRVHSSIPCTAEVQTAVEIAGQLSESYIMFIQSIRTECQQFSTRPRPHCDNDGIEVLDQLEQEINRVTLTHRENVSSIEFIESLGITLLNLRDVVTRLLLITVDDSVVYDQLLEMIPDVDGDDFNKIIGAYEACADAADIEQQRHRISGDIFSTVEEPVRIHVITVPSVSITNYRQDDGNILIAVWLCAAMCLCTVLVMAKFE